MRTIDVMADVTQLAQSWGTHRSFFQRFAKSKKQQNNNNNGNQASDTLLKKSRELFMLEEKEMNLNFGPTCLAVCIPFYNEDALDMHRTLMSLHTALLELLCKFGNKKAAEEQVTDVVIFLIGDGYAKCSESMREYLAQLFASSSIDELEPDRKSTAKIIAPSSSKVKDQRSSNPIPLDKSQHNFVAAFHSVFKLRLLMKAENAGKHNSQEWFLKLAAPALGCRYVFMTDCGTFFQKDCLMFLLRHLIKNPDNCVGVTGHQRVMRWGDQNMDFSLHNMLFTFAQGFDYEASQSLFSVPFAAIGSLPVIPGPCGMYNLELLQESGAIDAYFEALRVDTASTRDLVAGNLCLAEDRILCFEAVKRSHWMHKTAIDPRAVFFFEAETDAERLLQQRRRWHNGTVAGYVRSWGILASQLFTGSTSCLPSFGCGRLGPQVEDPLEHKGDGDVEDPQIDDFIPRKKSFCGSFLASLRMMLSFVLVSLQLLMHFFMVLSIGIFSIAFHFALQQLFPSSEAFVYNQALLILYLFLNLTFVLLHHRRSLIRLHKPVFYVLLSMNVLVSIVICLGYAVFIWNNLQPTVDDPTKLFDSTYLIRLLPFFWFIMTMILALMHGIRSFSLWLTYLVPYVLLLPTMVSTVPLYAMCRMWELSWGNRPTDPSWRVKRDLNAIATSDGCSQLVKQYIEDGQMQFDKGQYESALTTLEAARRLLHAEESAKLLSGAAQGKFSRKWWGRTATTEEGKAKVQSIDAFQKYVRCSKELQDQCTVLVFVSVLLNALLALLMVELQAYLDVVVLWFTACVFFPVLIFQVIAVFFWLYFLVAKRQMGLYPCWQGFKRCCFPSYRHRYQPVQG